MRYRLTVEINDPEGKLGDSPDPQDLEAWARYLDIPTDAEEKLVKVEVIP